MRRESQPRTPRGSVNSGGRTTRCAEERGEFVAAITKEQPPAPPYFSSAAQRNRKQRTLLHEHLRPPALSRNSRRWARARWCSTPANPRFRRRTPERLGRLRARGAVRRVGRRRPAARPTHRGVPTGQRTRGQIRLGRIGFDKVVGYLDNPIGPCVTTPSCRASSRLTAADWRPGSVNRERPSCWWSTCATPANSSKG